MTIEEQIRDIARNYSNALQTKVQDRVAEMESDDKSHYLIYRVLGITIEEGDLIDVYQNKGRFLYRYAGSFLEHATKACFETEYPDAKSLRIPNTIDQRPKTFGIDLLIENRAYEIKWRDATTDGDHITKEHTRIRAVAQAGFTPVRLMYFSPNRDQAMRIQAAIHDLYKANNGLYYSGDEAWKHLEQTTGVDLFTILEDIAAEKSK
ncbi:MAG: ApaLI family restriction endonuclease [Chloroflexota bacterium]|nr:ApaLI family restriction endonuclease [Chloroflexota bacterium]MDE2852677.1 ApaLI family restriction endonuclease [Chloroflexota bacterium]MDE2948072.1 ApaLI family restriction endonuclease [Chloroflexota bacterium]